MSGERRAPGWIGKAFLAPVLLLLFSAAAGAAYQALATRRDAKRYPPPGQLIATGMAKLHILCMGTGSPAVVLDSPAGASHLAWSLVQPGIAERTRVCAYDRAGYGWSEPGPQPRTSGEAVEELRAFLKAAEIPPPYVLVGNSLGGLNARLYAFRYPGEVAGLVLVDPVHEAQQTRLPPSARIQPSMIRMLALFRIASRLGLLRLLGIPLGEGSSDKLPGNLVPAARAMGFRTAWADAVQAEVKGLDASFEEVQAARRARGERPLGSLPLIVLTRDEEEEGVPDAARALTVWTALHKEISEESTEGRQVIVRGSGHFIQADQPQAVVEAIKAVVQQVQNSGRKGGNHA